MVDKDGGWHTWVPSGSHYHAINLNHSHEIIIPSHAHSVTIPAHNHSVNIPAHSHSVTIPEHVHTMIYGIYEGPTPTILTIEVDGNTVPITSVSGTNVDIIPYLSKDSAGRIVRGWHEIKITPNDLGRIVANVTMQIFVQSRGGGDY
ncbi:hypothetical protein D3C73_1083880 [compost metagenome]